MRDDALIAAINKTIRDDRFLSIHFDAYQQVCSLCKELSVLDIGCGYGWGTYLLASKARCVSGIDVDPDRIKFADQVYKLPNLSFYCGAIQDLGLKRYFDIACMVQVIQNTLNPIGLLFNVSNALKEKSLLFIATKRGGRWSNLQLSEIELIVCLMAYAVGFKLVSKTRVNKSDKEKNGSQLTMCKLWFRNEVYK